MFTKTEQQRFKAIITEAITVLCKEYLGFRSNLSIEGLLGITLDDDDILLISIRELINKEKNETVYRQETNSDLPQKAIESAALLAQAQAAKTHSLILQQATLHQQRQHMLQEQGQELSRENIPVRSLEQVLLPSITGPTILMSPVPSSVGSDLSTQILSSTPLPFRTLDQMPSSAAVIANRRTISIPLSQSGVSSDQVSYTSTIDSGLGSSINSSLPSPQVSQKRRRTNSDHSEPPVKRSAISTGSSNDSGITGGGVENLVVKHEPISDSETEGTRRSVDSDYVVQTPVYSVSSSEGLPGLSVWSPSISVTPGNTVCSPSVTGATSTHVSSSSRSSGNNFCHTNHHSNHGSPSRSLPTESPGICTIHRSILEQSGCIVFASNVVLQDGTKTHTRTNAHMVQAMQEMTYPIGHPRHVGQYKEVMAGRYSRKVFYKCPPEIVRQEILNAYGINPKSYTKMFYSDVKPVTSSSKWFETVETLMLNFPYGPRMFPLQMMGLTEDQMRVLSMVRVYKENKLNHK